MYDDLKMTDYGETYTGMRIGGKHEWQYRDGKWVETKESPERWNFTFDCVKTRARAAPADTGAQVQTKYHWYILADQIATKINNNSYMTSMTGVKFKVGHQRPYWRAFSYEYPGQAGYRAQVIAILERALRQLKDEPSEQPNYPAKAKNDHGSVIKSNLD